MWESFPLNFKLIQTTWVWNLAPEIFQPKGLGATWQDAALQKVMALTDAPWSSCLHKPIPPQSPSPYCRLSTRRTSPSPAPRPSLGACGGSESAPGAAGSYCCYFPFSPLSIYVPCVLHLELGARWELTAYKLEVSVMQPAPSLSGCQGLHWSPKLYRGFTFLSIKAWRGFAHWRNRTTSQQQLKAPQTGGGTVLGGES